MPFIRFDSYLLFADYAHLGKLLLTYLLFFIPFFLGALAIGLVFVKNVDVIGKIYFANLLGSGAGEYRSVAAYLVVLSKSITGVYCHPACIGGTDCGSKKQTSSTYWFCFGCCWSYHLEMSAST